MLHSFMIISGRGGIVLFRKVLTKSINQPRLIAGLVTALCEFSVGSVAMPVATIELELFTISIVELPVDNRSEDGEYLRAVLFHDTHDVRWSADSVAHNFVTFQLSACRTMCDLLTFDNSTESSPGRYLRSCSRFGASQCLQTRIRGAIVNDAISKCRRCSTYLPSIRGTRSNGRCWLHSAVDAIL